jgi:hypothetical protein
MRFRSAFTCVIVCAACASAPRPTYSTTFSDRRIRIDSYAKAFRAAEPGLAQSLAYDTRLFARIAAKPSPADVADHQALAFGAGEWLSRSYADPFMFTDREASLDHARESFDHVAADAALQAEWAGARASGDTRRDPLLAALRIEQLAFRRLLDAEDARLERERSSAKGAAALVRAMSLGWPIAPDAAALHEIESSLAFRFGNVEEMLAPNSLSAAEREDLRDALAQLAPRVAPMPRAAAAMVKLRTAIDAMWVTPFPNEDETELDKELALYVGAPVAFDALDGAFESAERAFAQQVDAGTSVLDDAARARVSARALEIFARAPDCKPRVPIRTSLDLAPPDERAWSCTLVHALDDAHTDEQEIAADLAFLEAIVVARWAVATHGPVRSPDAAMTRAPLRAGFALSRVDAARVMTFAEARPWRAISAGVAASILTKYGAGRARARAQKWRTLGDAPMDLVDDALGAH